MRRYCGGEAEQPTEDASFATAGDTAAAAACRDLVTPNVAVWASGLAGLVWDTLSVWDLGLGTPVGFICGPL